MKNLKVVLNNGLKGCCSSYTAEEMRKFTRNWFKESDGIKMEIIDIVETFWGGDPLADLAYKHFKDSIFPLTYLDGQLVLMGRFPEGKDLSEIFQNPKPITEKMILKLVELKKKAE